MLTFKEYTRAIDMWSVGCVLAEMLSGKPMFPGRDCEWCLPPWNRFKCLQDHDQLSLILDILGTPSIDDFYAISSPRSREYIRALPFRKGKDFKTMFHGANELVRFG
jgi:mitogen-activated protein kinase 1/3